jgi:hypothetical protein
MQTTKKEAPVELTGGDRVQLRGCVASRFFIDLEDGGKILGTEYGKVTGDHWQAWDRGRLIDDLEVTFALDGEAASAGVSCKKHR